MAETAGETGNSFDLDQARLAEVFSEWLDAFNAQKPHTSEDQRAYVGFAAGLMLRALLHHKPVKGHVPADADKSNPAYFWPEGYLYVVFCLNVRGMVIEIDFEGEQALSAELDDLRTWWSFKENVGEDPSFAIAFLDLFAGDKPEWSTPDIFHSDDVDQFSGRFYSAKLAEPDE
ncbi:MAG: hypothetical protein HKN27_09815 [Silicimonas sp.]|nr:hypothetical protein [Silicimonas sp.]